MGKKRSGSSHSTDYTSRYRTPSDGADVDHEEEEDEEQEVSADYKKGGYHPVNLGDTYNGYQIIRKLGWGYYSTVWLAYDKSLRRHVAVKIIKSDKQCTEVALDEMKMLKAASEQVKSQKDRRVVKMLDNFTITGPNGIHTCIVFQLMGPSLLSLIIKHKFEGLPIRSVKSIIKQTLLGLDYIHRECNMIHTDIKPENILLETNEREAHATAKTIKELWTTGHQLPSAAVCNLPDSRSDRKSKKKERKRDRKKHRKSKRGGKHRRDTRRVKFSDKQAVKDRARLRRKVRKLRAQARRSADSNEDRDYRRQESLSGDSDLSDYDYLRPDAQPEKRSLSSRGRPERITEDRKSDKSDESEENDYEYEGDDYEPFSGRDEPPSKDRHYQKRHGGRRKHDKREERRRGKEGRHKSSRDRRHRDKRSRRSRSKDDDYEDYDDYNAYKPTSKARHPSKPPIKERRSNIDKWLESSEPKMSDELIERDNDKRRSTSKSRRESRWDSKPEEEYSRPRDRYSERSKSKDRKRPSENVDDSSVSSDEKISQQRKKKADRREDISHSDVSQKSDESLEDRQKPQKKHKDSKKSESSQRSTNRVQSPTESSSDEEDHKAMKEKPQHKDGNKAKTAHKNSASTSKNNDQNKADSEGSQETFSSDGDYKKKKNKPITNQKDKKSKHKQPSKSPERTPDVSSEDMEATDEPEVKTKDNKKKQKPNAHPDKTTKTKGEENGKRFVQREESPSSSTSEVELQKGSKNRAKMTSKNKNKEHRSDGSLSSEVSNSSPRHPVKSKGRKDKGSIKEDRRIKSKEDDSQETLSTASREEKPRHKDDNKRKNAHKKSAKNSKKNDQSKANSEGSQETFAAEGDDTKKKDKHITDQKDKKSKHKQQSKPLKVSHRVATPISSSEDMEAIGEKKIEENDSQEKVSNYSSNDSQEKTKVKASKVKVEIKHKLKESNASALEKGNKQKRSKGGIEDSKSKVLTPQPGSHHSVSSIEEKKLKMHTEGGSRDDANLNHDSSKSLTGIKTIQKPVSSEKITTREVSRLDSNTSRKAIDEDVNKSSSSLIGRKNRDQSSRRLLLSNKVAPATAAEMADAMDANISKSLIELTVLSDRLKNKVNRERKSSTQISAVKEMVEKPTTSVADKGNVAHKELDAQSLRSNDAKTVSKQDQNEIKEVDAVEEENMVLKKGLDWTGYSIATKHAVEENMSGGGDEEHAEVTGSMEILNGKPIINHSQRRATVGPQLVRSVFIDRVDDDEETSIKKSHSLDFQTANNEKKASGSFAKLIGACCGLKKNSNTGFCCGKSTKE